MRHRFSGRSVLFGGAVAAATIACAPIALSGPDCVPTRTGVPLPPELDESSGVAEGRRDPSVLWTHNDDGSVLFAVDSDGAVLARWDVRPVLRDWEDIAAGDCDRHGSCLYLADTGDNAERRDPGSVRLVRVAEPDPADAASELETEVFPFRLPDGPRDIEALFVLPGERPFLVTKGRNHAVTVYRYPPPLRPDTVLLEETQRLGSAAAPLADQVTGASASPDGRSVAIRTYQALEFFAVDGDSLTRVDDGRVNLRSLQENQGEAVALGAEGRVVLTSEGGLFGALPGMNFLRCEAGV